MDVNEVQEQKLQQSRIAIIGSLLLEPDLAGEIMQRVRPEDFGVGYYRSLFDACCRLFAAMKPIDPLNLNNILNLIPSELKNYNKIAQESKNTAEDIPTQINRLADLRDAGILTESEFHQKKESLLSKM